MTIGPLLRWPNADKWLHQSCSRTHNQQGVAGPPGGEPAQNLRTCQIAPFISADKISLHALDGICTLGHTVLMTWTVEIGDEFEAEFDGLHEEVRTEILALSRLLQQFGPQLGRPRVDTLKGSSHANMKELRFGADDGEWRVAFAFDTKRKAIMLVAGDKSGVSERVFYRQLITKADKRFDAHLNRLKQKELKEKESKQREWKKRGRK